MERMSKESLRPPDLNPMVSRAEKESLGFDGLERTRVSSRNFSGMGLKMEREGGENDDGRILF